MKKIIVTCILTFALVFAFAFSCSATALATNQFPGINGDITVIPHETKELFVGTYIVIPEISAGGRETYTALSQFNPVTEADGEARYQLEAWLLDQMQVKLESKHGHVSNIMFILRGAGPEADRFVFGLPADSRLRFPNDRMSLILEVSDQGVLYIPPQSLNFDLTEIVFEVQGDELFIRPMSGQAEIYDVEMYFEPGQSGIPSMSIAK